ncbi:serine/threonine protein kinase [Enemella evansiae]|nr:serine/threonine protein kinase [Enemella evansiae]OYO02541.1 serine/threonine protein kinase [Enemella evansiae]
MPRLLRLSPSGSAVALAGSVLPMISPGAAAASGAPATAPPSSRPPASVPASNRRSRPRDPGFTAPLCRSPARYAGAARGCWHADGMGEVFGGRFELVDPIGAGGAGTVWRVWDWKEFGYRAAKLMKQSDSIALLRFIRETGTRIDHPHVLAPTSWVGEDDRVLFTMDLVSGGSVGTMINDYGPLPDWFSMIIIDQLLSALETVHASGLIHRDIKPGNLLLAATGTALPSVRLADFGIAARIDDPRLTHTTEVVGTPGYMSALARMGTDPEPAQDLYATAMVLGEMLTGQRPRETDPPVDLAAAGVSAPLTEFVERLAAESGHGFGSAAEARRALRGIRASGAAESDPIEVFDQIGPLPEGWGPNGPGPRAGASAATVAITGTGTGTPTRGTTVETAPRRRTPKSVWVLGISGLICLLVALVLAIF